MTSTLSPNPNKNSDALIIGQRARKTNPARAVDSHYATREKLAGIGTANNVWSPPEGRRRRKQRIF